MSRHLPSGLFDTLSTEPRDGRAGGVSSHPPLSAMNKHQRSRNPEEIQNNSLLIQGVFQPTTATNVRRKMAPSVWKLAENGHGWWEMMKKNAKLGS